MPWYTPWSDHIAKRVCKYLLQRYLGQFMEEKLTLDQLNVDLYKGIGIISDVSLDVQALNDVAAQQNIPFEFIDGFVGEVSVSVPWSSILNDATYIEVKGLTLTIKQKEREKTRASMFESMWSSMSSSMQLAEDCLKNEKNEEGKEESSSFEGIEHFAQTIDSILSRIKVKFLDTTMRLEEILYEGASGVAFELDIKLMDYADEAGLEPDQDKKQDYQLPVFSTKKIFLEGVTVYSSEFPVLQARSSSCEHENQNETGLEEEECSDSIILGRLSGRQEVTIKFKQEGISGPKIELEISLGAFTIFTTPHQAHNLLDLISGVTAMSQTNFRNDMKLHCPERKMDDSDYRKIEQELLMNMNSPNVLQPKGLTDQGWANMSLDVSDDEFSPLNHSSKLNSSIISSATSLSGSTSSISSSKSSFSHSKQLVFRSKKSVHSGNADLDSSSVVFHFHVLLSSLAIILLHDDILTASSELGDTALMKSSVEEMKRTSKEFFERLGHFAVVGYGHKDFSEAQKLFSRACNINHLRFLAAPVIIEGSETCTVNTSVIKGNCTAASLDIRECLFEKGTPAQKISVEYVELLKFARHCTSDKREIYNVFESNPNMKLMFKLSNSTLKPEKSRKHAYPKSEFSLNLQPCEVEVDITIIDRISALLHKDSFYGSKGSSSSITRDEVQKQTIQSHFQENFREILPKNSKMDLKISSPFIVFKLRFPVPDFRPIHDMDKPPWWKRSVRPDILYFDITDLVFHTSVKSQETVLKLEAQFKDAIVKFREGECDKAIPFIRASVDPNYEASSEYEQGLGWPRLVVHVFPKMSKAAVEESEQCSGYFKSSASSVGHQSLITTLENNSKREHSPFSCKKVVHESDTPHSKVPDQTEGEELVIPGDKAEIADFIDIASLNTRIKIDLSLPCASLVFPSKHMYEVVYNRISSDLLLWEPSAPIHSNSSNYTDFNCWSANDMINEFHLCKSGIQSESDSDSESEGLFYSAYEQKLRYKKKQLLEKQNLVGQSKVVFHLNVTQGLGDIYTPARDSQGNVIPGQHGQLHVSFDEGNLFLVSGYKGKSDLDYMCVQVNSFNVFHNGLISDELQKYTYVGSKVPAYLQQLVHSTEKCASVDQTTQVGTRSPSSLDMLTVSLRVDRSESSTHSLKMFQVAAGIRNATLRHVVSKGQTSWFTQLIDFFEVDDYPIAGYEPCSVLTEINVHLWNCCVDYRPLYLPIRSLLTVGNFNISSNMAAQTNSSTLRFIAEEAAFFISDKTTSKLKYVPPDLRKDYVCVGEIGLFELSLRLSEKNQPHPKIDLRTSGNVAHVWTCADSAKALAELLMYFASDGDFTANESDAEESSPSKTATKEDENLLIKTADTENTNILSKSQVSLVIDLMEEAMKEPKVESVDKKVSDGIPKVIYFEMDPKMSAVQENTDCMSLGSEFKEGDETEGKDQIEQEDNWENEFCILEHEAGLGILPKKGLPEVRNLTGTPVRLVDNHFSVPLGKADLLRSPKHYPKPVLRYLLREMSVVWHMYGGSDFGPHSQSNKHVKIGQSVGGRGEGSVSYSKHSVPGLRFEYPNANSDSNIPWKERGGPKRRHDILMELQLNKIRFQHEVYPENTNEASRQVLLIQDVELRDRLATSPINKFLYQYTSEAKPKQSEAPMVIIKSVLMRSDPKLNAQECCLKVSLLPLRLNIDQDSVLFLYSFFNEISGDFREEVEEETVSKPQNTVQQTPVMSVNVEGEKPEAEPESQNYLIQLEEENQTKTKSKMKSKRKGFAMNNKQPSPPLFFRCFIFSPDVPVKLDYQGKRVDMTHGPLAGILMGLGQLNNSELKLRKISYRHGLLGFDKLLNFVLSEWTNDIKKNQLPSLLGGVGPMHSLVQLIQGIRDLFWLPIEQYQRDGRLVRGFQRGANSFTTSTAMACLELTSRVIQLIQSTAETAYDMVSPGPSVRRRRGNGKRRRHTQPADIREGVTNAYLVVKEGIGETAETIVRVASEEHEQKGVTGAVGGVLRQIPPTVVKPIILATEATNNVIGGMRSQLVPDARKEAVEKWRKQDI